MMNFFIAGKHPTWLQILAALPAAVMLWGLISWTPRGRREWFLAAAMMAYIVYYYFIFVLLG